MTEDDLRFYMFNKLVEIGSVLMDYYDCCGIDGDKCVGGDPNPCCYNSIFNKGLCCFWQNSACQFPNSDCKLWLCNSAIESTDPECIKVLKFLEEIGKIYNLVRPPFIGHPYSGADKQEVK